MEIILTYRGRVPGQKRTSGNLDAIWRMREAFHRQLEKLWGKAPFTILKDWEDSDFAAGAPDFRRARAGCTFIPFYGRHIGICVSLEIQLLTGFPAQKSVLVAGDIDNRIKRITDALRVPNVDETRDEMSVQRWYSLLEDDNAVLSLTASTGTYLASDDPTEAFVFVRVRPIPVALTADNLEMAL
ncbi:hypothetical protein XM25_20250 [Devosia sp. H5989]|nr:hypothetical protein XM25_20250 [Devosia sp. H5989]